VLTAVIALAVICLALLWLLRDQQARHQEAMDQREAAYTDERRELLTRIQKPELVPIKPNGRLPQPKPTDHEALSQVGSLTDFDADG
jgi:hypothetical protein